METHTPKASMKIAGLVREYKLEPHQMTERFTKQSDLFVLAHMGVPDIAKEDWRLTIDGLVDNPLVMDFDELLKQPKKIVETVHQCAGSPMNPTVPTRQVSNVKWAGVDLRELFSKAGIHPGACYVWAYGQDHGKFAGEAQDCYLKDLPLSRVDEGDVLIAYELNGAPLSAKHGFPARLVVPGFFGTNSVKWLNRLHVAEGRASSIFTTRFYNDPVPDTESTRPVWEIFPESVIVAPARESKLKASNIEIWGWAWSASDVERVDVSVDGGNSWSQACLEPRSHRCWQKFSLDWSVPRAGRYQLISKATDSKGQTQPMDGARNSVYAVPVEIDTERRMGSMSGNG